MAQTKLVVIDVETTGLQPERDSIVELAASILSADDLEEHAVFQSRIFTDVAISEQAHAVHGLSSNDLIKEPSLASVLREFAAFVPANCILCGHNVAFDA